MATIQTFDYSVNLSQAVLWQYNDATNILELISLKQAWYDQYFTQFWDDWFNNVFNLQTANLFGLSVWSIILNVPIYVPFQEDSPDKPIWGFNNNQFYPTLENTYTNFGFGNFSSRGDSIILTEEEQRFLLRLRYYQLTTRGEVWDINRFLNYLVNSSDIGFTGQMYALDGLDMSIRYVMTNDTFPSNLLDALVQLDILPRPAGVLIDGVIINNDATWGFSGGTFGDYENTYTNFGYGNFYDSIFTPY